MQINCDKKTKKIWLSRERYVEWVLEKFNMKHAKLVSTPLTGYFKLGKKSCSIAHEEKDDMTIVP